MISDLTKTRMFHFENLIKGHIAFDRDKHNIIAKTVEHNNNTALAVMHPGYCREIIKNRIKYTSWPPVIYNSIKDNAPLLQSYLKDLSALIGTTSVPIFVFCEQHKIDILARWTRTLKPKSPVVLVKTWTNSPLPLAGWEAFARTGNDLGIKSLNGVGEIRLKVNGKDEGCAVGLYNNLQEHFKVDLLTEYTFPNLSFEILTEELQRGYDTGAVLDPVSLRYIFLR
jgi:hypothetical protein